MTLYHEEKEFIDNFKAKVASGENITQADLIALTDKFEDMIEMTSVTVKIIDRLMQNQDRLKQQTSSELSSVKKA